MSIKESPKLEDVKRVIKKRENMLLRRLVGGKEASQFFTLVAELDEEFEIDREWQRVSKLKAIRDRQKIDWNSEDDSEEAA